MTGIDKIKSDIKKEFVKTAKHPLGPGVGPALTGIFALTVGKFAADARRGAGPVDVWTKPKFKSFILGQARRIAKEADRNVTSGVITAPVLLNASVKVMTKTQKFCKIAIKNGKIAGLRPGHIKPDGDVCSSFLAGQTY